ncbi:MAG TPA: hypothetical protein PKB11_15560 [Desulfovibrio sp.]|jgi:cell division protein ZapB|uniref:hypothetical protein n=1 Tax=Desulfovibrio TaxID=872 RepID=UPI0003FEFDAA|nr:MULTISPECIES: hypothetical protein [Desulfovibrio]MDY0307155.1 hypothetical protein [Desulfovibrionaceae bacterium]HMM40173.1 hypothetical protein [Desulfovibrio sp.]
MEPIAQLESRFEAMLERIKTLEQENTTLRQALENESAGRRDVQERVENLLRKIETELG